jgi:hypothetical protein
MQLHHAGPGGPAGIPQGQPAGWPQGPPSQQMAAMNEAVWMQIGTLNDLKMSDTVEANSATRQLLRNDT